MTLCLPPDYDKSQHFGADFTRSLHRIFYIYFAKRLKNYAIKVTSAQKCRHSIRQFPFFS